MLRLEVEVEESRLPSEDEALAMMKLLLRLSKFFLARETLPKEEIDWKFLLVGE